MAAILREVRNEVCFNLSLDIIRLWDSHKFYVSIHTNELVNRILDLHSLAILLKLVLEVHTAK